jgi:hypothetical protein
MTGQVYPIGAIPEMMADPQPTMPQKIGLPIHAVRWQDFMRKNDSNRVIRMGIDMFMTGWACFLCLTFTCIKMSGNEKLPPDGAYQWQVRLISQDAGRFQASAG